MMNDKNANRENGSTSTEHESLAVDDFSTFFRDVHGVDPFPWQERLANRVLCNNDWPSIIDLPTGTGKTAVLDIAIFALAVNPGISPRRIVFVVDRRIVVDQVFKRAQIIRDRIRSKNTETLRKVFCRLNALCPAEELGVVALRGGIPIDNEWTHRPDQPWVMVSTVDQYGSRLLFRGYGVTSGMRPIHAGLAGNDCLVILDEVHLSIPFMETLKQVDSWETNRIPRRFRVVQMSATPTEDTANSFKLTSGDLCHCDELYRRVNASKRAKLEPVNKVDDIPLRTKKLIQTIRKTDSRVSCVGVIVNRVRTAREVYKLLSESGYSTHLVTGRMRPLDRVNVVQSIESVANPDRSRHGNNSDFAIVVATQAIEVGADFDFDALITECAAYDSLKQRVGRLDRRGKLSECGRASTIWILGVKSVTTSKSPDPIYGEALKSTWNELKTLEDESGFIEVGRPSAQEKLPESAYATPDAAPVMLKTYMDAFVQTRPAPIVQPSIEWFLHGMSHDQSEPDVSLVWRWDDSSEGLRAVPPRRAEFMQVPISAVKSWLKDEQEVDISDMVRTIAKAKTRADSPHNSEERVVKCVRWQGSKRADGKIDNVRDVEDIQPGDILVVHPKVGGIGAGTWDPSSKNQVEDLGDQAQLSYGRRVTLRLHPKLVGCSLTLPKPSAEEASEFPTHLRIRNCLKQLQEDENVLRSDWMNKVVDQLLESGFDTSTVQQPKDVNGIGDYFVLTERVKKSGKRKIDVSQLDSSDELVSLTGTGTTLENHLEGVGTRAKQIAANLGLSRELVDDLFLAGRLHDIGKIDSRFQEFLVGGDPVELELCRENPLAKSHPNARYIRSNYPRGMRHEIASVAMIESNFEVISQANDPDLVLHLVGTHHGWGRPLPPIVDDSDPQQLIYSLGQHRMEVNSDLVDSTLTFDMTERFWRLTECYGYYGLVWMESILRLADHQQSAHEAELP